MIRIFKFQTTAIRGPVALPTVEQIKAGILYPLLLLPGFVAAGDDYLANFTNNIEYVSVYTSFYSQHFSPEPDHVNDQKHAGR